MFSCLMAEGMMEEGFGVKGFGGCSGWFGCCFCCCWKRRADVLKVREGSDENPCDGRTGFSGHCRRLAWGWPGRRETNGLNGLMTLTRQPWQASQGEMSLADMAG